MKPQSAKAKGRLFQQQIRDKLIEQLEIHPEDIKSTSMGAGGEDITMARAAREKFPLSIECKAQESLSVWKAYEQAEANCGDYEPVLFIKKNRKKPLVVVDADYFISLFKPWRIIKKLLRFMEVINTYEPGETWMYFIKK